MTQHIKTWKENTDYLPKYFLVIVSEHVPLCAIVRYRFSFLINENQMAKPNIFYGTGRYLVDIAE